MTQNIKGKLVFFPEDGSEPYEINLENLIEESDQSWFSKILSRFKSFKVEKQEEKPKTTMLVQRIDLTQLVCEKMEQLLSSVQWHPKEAFESFPSYVIDVYPAFDKTGWEPMVTVTISSGSSLNIPLIELLYNYVPIEQEQPNLKQQN